MVCTCRECGLGGHGADQGRVCVQKPSIYRGLTRQGLGSQEEELRFYEVGNHCRFLNGQSLREVFVLF